MALPASRVIGHKEYAAGRKSDPQYAMAWMRDRVAAFKPRNATPVAPEDEVTDADIQKIVAALRGADFSPAEGTQSLQNLTSQTNTALTAKVDRIDVDAKGPEEGDVVPVSRAKMVEYVDARTRRLERDMAEVLSLLRNRPEPPPAA